MMASEQVTIPADQQQSLNFNLLCIWDYVRENEDEFKGFTQFRLKDEFSGEFGQKLSLALNEGWEMLNDGENEGADYFTDFETEYVPWFIKNCTSRQPHSYHAFIVFDDWKEIVKKHAEAWHQALSE